MARGFLNGALWGSAASICALGLLSTFAEGPVAPAVKANAPATNQAPRPVASDTNQSQGDRVPVTGQQAPKAPAPKPDTLAAVPKEATASAAQPETGEASALSDPAVDASQPGIGTRQNTTPVVPGASSAGLEAPAAEPSLSVSTDPAEPVAPKVTEELALTEDPVQPTAPGSAQPSSGLSTGVEEPASAPEVSTSISVDPDQPPLPDVPTETQAFETPEVPEAPSEALPVQPSQAPEATPQDDEIAQADAVPEGDATPDAVATPDPVPAPEETPAEATPTPEPDVQTAQTPDADEVLSNPGTPAGTVGNLAPEVQINRLPTLGGQTEPDAETITQLPEAEEDLALPEPGDLRPVERYAQPFENVDNKPVMAIVLMDEGVDLSRDTIGLPALRSFPYPISFAVDTSLPDAQARMAAYRAEGFEVLATIDLPQGAKARDAEVSLAVALEAVPEAVGVLEGIGEGVQSSRDAAQQVTEILAETGHGFVTQNKGLNTVQKLAAKAGVPSAVVFRDFDSSQQSPTVIRRFLDQAAFRAGNEGGVIMLGRLREDTISALLIWGLQDRAERVALVPVSAALKAQ
ncbi:divergent polysaccharide deacetylase family protein [uncultured Roseobacter sp.]|uniref:divergent polysaccharide deacetylase family protein n=1 Tax=uncultured Roseobacter sp. TaxID=114847 RepID=UPI002614EC65|nr:divergent polysaccharide deacetylase family protein [uncultured Roseobacter sp.]